MLLILAAAIANPGWGCCADHGAAGDCGAPGPAPMLMEGVAVVPADDAATNGAPMEVDGAAPDGAAAAP